MLDLFLLNHFEYYYNFLKINKTRNIFKVLDDDDDDDDDILISSFVFFRSGFLILHLKLVSVGFIFNS